MINHALRKWRSGAAKGSVGGWLVLGNALSAEMMARCAFDWLVVDMQHGLIDYKDLLSILPAIQCGGPQCTPLVRVPSADPGLIGKVLDAGAHGVILPLCNTPDDAKAFVNACFYPGRSFGPTRARLGIEGGGLGYAASANAEVAPIVMIETKQGLENVEAIVKTPGLGAIYIGPADLAGALGLPYQGDTDASIHMEAVTRILSVCKAHGVPCGIHTGSAEWTTKRLAAGFEFVTLGIDADWMMRGAQSDMAKVKGLPNPPGTRPMNVDVLWKVVRSSNATYVNALKLMWTSMRGWGGGTAAGSSEAAADEHEQEGDKTAKKAAKALRDAQHTAPEAIRAWLKPRLALLGNALLEFGRGFREGKNGPSIEFNFKELIAGSPSKKKQGNTSTKQ